SCLKGDALRGVRIGIGRDFFGGDPEIDALAEAAAVMIERLGAKLIDVRFERDFFAHYVRDGLKTVMPILMYAFRDAFETYLAGLDADVPKTVEEWAKAYSTELRNSQFPPEESRPSHASLVLKEALNHSSADEDYRSMIEDTLPMLTRTKRELFQRFSIAA